MKVFGFIPVRMASSRLPGKPLRLILINSINGPSITDIFYILDKKNTLIRLNKYIDMIK